MHACKMDVCAFVCVLLISFLHVTFEFSLYLENSGEVVLEAHTFLHLTNGASLAVVPLPATGQQTCTHTHAHNLSQLSCAVQQCVQSGCSCVSTELLCQVKKNNSKTGKRRVKRVWWHRCRERVYKNKKRQWFSKVNQQWTGFTNAHAKNTNYYYYCLSVETKSQY